MLKIWSFRNNRKGVSTLFIAIYLILIVSVLLLTIFIGLSFSNAGITSYQKIQQDKNQEKIILLGFNADDSNRINSVLIQNLGAITVRIRALYVGNTFICDPSKSTGDSYISPQETWSLPLDSHEVYANASTLKADWTITTERGTTTSETGSNLWVGGKEFMNDPNKVYYGPLCLYFNSFQWSNNGGETWNPGWTISEKPGSVIWRINITNVDERIIYLDTKSSFTLIQNSQQSNKIAKWDIGPASLNPKDYTLLPFTNYSLCFSLNGPNSLSEMGTPIPIASNFLTILGSFQQPDGTLKPFAQTIPFEAVLINIQTEIFTATTLNAIPSSLTCMQPVTVSGKVVPLNSTDPQVPKSSPVMIQYSLVGKDDWEDIYPAVKTSDDGLFTGSFAPPHAGTYQFHALFIGAETSKNAWAPSFSLPQTLVINKAPSSISLDSLNAITLGQSVTLTARVNQSFATGTVLFELSKDSGSTYSFLSNSLLNSGIATYTYTPTTAGTNYQIRATYNGDSDVAAPLTSAVRALTVNKATPVISIPTLSPASPITLGESTTPSTTFTGVAVTAATGNIVFQYSIDGGANWIDLRSIPISVNPIVSDQAYTPNAVSTLYRIRAFYAGDSNYNMVTSGSASLFVRGVPTVSPPILSPVSPVKFGTPVTVAATVSGTYGVATGNLAFQVSIDGGAFTTFSTVALSAGSATSTAYLPPAAGLNYQFQAIYLGDNTYTPQTSLSTQLVVEKALPTISVSFPPAMPSDQYMHVIATLNTSLATGTVTFEYSTDGTNFAAFGANAIVNGATAFSSQIILPVNGSSYTFRATYNGDNNYLSSQHSTPVTLHLVSFTQSGVDTDFTQTVVTVGGTGYGRTGYTAWYPAGTNVDFTYQSPLTIGGKRYVLDQVSAFSPLPINGPTTVTGLYDIEYFLTVNQIYGTSTGQGWYQADSTAYAGVTSDIVGTSGTRYLFINWANGASGNNYAMSDAITMNGPKTATATWQTQYELTMATNLGTTSPQVGSNWYNANSIVPISATSPNLAYSVDLERYSFITWTGVGVGSCTGDSSNAVITMNGPITETASWNHQYYLTVSDGGHGIVGGAGWYNAGSTAQATMTPLTVDETSGTRYAFAGWTDDATGSGSPSNNLPMDRPKTATATWIIQYAVTFDQTGLESDAIGTVLTVNGITKTLGDLPNTVWADASSSVSYSYTDTVSGANGIQYTKTSSDSLITELSGPETVTGTYKTQYQLTLTANFGTVSPVSGTWFDAGTTISISATPPSPGADEQYIWNGWTGSGTNAYTGTEASPSITMNGPVTETASWIHQYQVSASYSTNDASVPSSSLTLTGTYLGSSQSTTLTSDSQLVWLDANTAWTVNNPITGSATERWNTPTTTGTVSGPINIAPIYYHQYQMVLQYTIANSPQGIPAVTNIVHYTIAGIGLFSTPALTPATTNTIWVDAGSSVAYTNPISGVSGERWKISPEGSANPYVVVDSVASAATLNPTYYHQYQTTFQYTITGTNKGTPTNPTATYTKFGSSSITTTALQTSPPNDWVDAGSSVAYTNPISGISGERWKISPETSATPYVAAISITSPILINPTYYHQYQLTVTATPSGAIGGSFNVQYTKFNLNANILGLTPWQDWVDAGTTATLTNPQITIGINKFSSYSPSSSPSMTVPQTITLIYYTTIGNTIPGTTQTQTLKNTIIGIPITATETGTLQSISAYADVGSGKHIKAALYSTSGSLLATTDEVITSNGARWITMAFSGTKPVLTAGTNYVLAIWADAGNIYYSSTSTNAGLHFSTGYSSIWPSTVTLSPDIYRYCIYGSYSTL